MTATTASTISVAIKGPHGSFRLDTTFDVPARGITALFGPSGCGKTTLLRCIAGLDQVPGRIAIGGNVWQDTASRVFRPPHLRRVGYVFQEPSLFPHLSVRNNLLFGQRRSAAVSTSVAPRTDGLDFDVIVGLLGIAHLLERSPEKLSGGERQRIAVGRALLSRPDVLLMDEPLSALDRLTKDEMLPYFEMLHETLELPVVYVSHDLAEIERLADVLVLMDKGRVVASGPLSALQTDLQLPFFGYPDASVVLEGTIAGHDPVFHLTRFAIAGGVLLAPGLHGALGAKRRLRIAASDVSLARSAPSDSTILNSLPARILSIDRAGDAPQVTAVLGLGDGGGCRIIARFTAKSMSQLGLAPGDAVYAQIKGVALVSSRTGKRAGSTQ